MQAKTLVCNLNQSFLLLTFSCPSICRTAIQVSWLFRVAICLATAHLGCLAGTLGASISFDVVLIVVQAANMFACRSYLDYRDDSKFTKRS